MALTEDMLDAPVFERLRALTAASNRLRVPKSSPAASAVKAAT
jgi:hypothetical protein